MAVTMKDIARCCGLSAGSVSQVIRNPDNPRFSPATRKLILDTAAKLDYHQNPLSCALRTNKTKLLGLMLPWNEPEVMDSIERIASENGFKLLIQFTAHPRSGMEQAALQSFLNWNVEGIIWEPSSSDDASFLPLLDKFKKEKRSLVMLERGVNGASFPVLQTDYAPALRACIEHLKSRNYEKVVFVFPGAQEKILEQQRGTFHNACIRNNLTFDSYPIGSGPDHAFKPSHAGDHICKKLQSLLLDGKNRNTAYICYSWLVSDVIEAMEAAGLSAPEEIGIVLFQDILLGGRYRFSNLLRPKLTSIRSDSTSLAECAINLLLSDIRGEASASATPYYGKAELSINKSTERK